MTTRELAKREEAMVAFSPEALIAKAIESGVSVESLERLLGMRERLKSEQAREAFIDAMATFQAECPVIEKTKSADRYKYAPLDKIVAETSSLRAKHGFSYRFDTRFEETPPAQVVVCIVSHRAGHQEASEFRSPIDGGARMNVMQQSASSLTYAKRYAFTNAFGIVTGDEDNDAATAGPVRRASPPRAQRSEPTGPQPGEVRMPPRGDHADRPSDEVIRAATCPSCLKTGTGIWMVSNGKIACARGKGGCGAPFDLTESEAAGVVQGELV